MTDLPPAADEPTAVDATPTTRRHSGGALFVSIGIFATKVFGVVRQSVLAKYIGSNATADALNAAIRIPSLLQNLLGDGAMSAAFIPLYVRLRANGDEDEAGRFAGAIFSILVLIVTLLVLLGVLLTPQILPLIAAGFKGEKRALAITFVRILFPASGLLVMSAWCLAILNSHRRFLLSYSAPVVSNLTVILALLWFGRRQDLNALAHTTAWAGVVGALAVFLVQLPYVLRLVPHLRLSFDTSRPSVRSAIRNFVPVGISRGVVQLSAYVDQLISSFLPDGMVSLLAYATTISYVPVSMFGMAIAAAELPEMSSVTGTEDERARQLRERLNAGLRRIAFFVIPSAMAMLVAGDTMSRLLFEHGHRFSAQDTIFTWSILAGSSFGLLAGTMGRLYSSTFYAVHDTRTPLAFAVVRVVLTSVLGYVFALPLPRMLGIDPHWGGAGLTLSFGVAGWVEFWLLRRGMNRRIGRTGPPASLMIKLWGSAIVAGAVAFGAKMALASQNKMIAGTIVLVGFGAVYIGATLVTGVPESTVLLRALRARIGGRATASTKR
ncbi:MAG: murein biosynthesis integral membrane protein MurJ [Gemmatimonadaceae bacterium]